MENWCYVSKQLRLLHRSILTVKSLKRTLYSLPKTTLIYPYTPLHDVNVTSIISNTRTHILIFYILANLPFDLYLKRGEEYLWFYPFSLYAIWNYNLFYEQDFMV